jgi:hypothetical protein
MAKFLTYGSRGDRVKRLQHALNDNPYFRPRRRLVIDGQMGTLTCAAVQRGKRRMGYPPKALAIDLDDAVAGKFFLQLLDGARRLPLAYRIRRRSRLAKIAAAAAVHSTQTKMRLAALAAIRDELGTMEAGGHSNVIRYNAWWGWGAVAYCVIGISWAWVVKAASTAFQRGVRWANTDAMLDDAMAGRNGLHLTNDPDPGCPGVIDFDGHSDPDHGITFVRDNGDGTCETYEFNTTGPNSMEGVWRKDRPLANCWWFQVEH